MEEIDMAMSVIILPSQMTLLRWLTFLLTSLTGTLTVLLYWIFLFLEFGLEWLSLHWKILIMLLAQLHFFFCETQKRML